MQRWQLTTGLAALTLAAAAIAPRLVTGAVAPLPDPPDPQPDVAPVTVTVEAPPEPTGHLSLEAGLDRTAVLAGEASERFLTVTIGAPEDLGTATRRTVDVSVVMDTSGSMSARGKIDYAKRAAKLLASSMEAGDVYSLVTFSDDARTIVPARSAAETAAIHRAIDGIIEGGGTNIYAGLDRGAAEVRRSLDGAGAGRVVLLSDGNANVGITDPDALARYASTLASQGISVSAVGLGLDYNEDLLARIADLGGGTYDFVDDPRDLEAVFADELQRSASIVAQRAKVRVTLPEGVEALDVFGWEASKEADGWTVDLGDVYAGESKKIVARVRVTGEAAGTLPVADVALEYHDLVSEGAGHATTVATAEVTRDRTLVEASIDKDNAIAANRAYGNWYLEQSARAYASGDAKDAQRLAGQGQQVLRGASTLLDAPALAQEAEEIAEVQAVYDAYEPASDEGRRAVKLGKEMYRDRAR